MSLLDNVPTLGGGQSGPIVSRHDVTVVDEQKQDSHSIHEKHASEADNSDVLSLQEARAAVVVNDGRPFPVDPDAPFESQQLTFRAVIVGSLLGFIVGAANVYLGLKTGFTFGATLFASMLGFAVLKPMSSLPPWLGGGHFGPKENVTVQSAAGASGGLSGLFVAAVPAMYQLGLLTTPSNDIGALVALSFITAFFGLFFAMPLRKYYILKQKLVFPSPTATAFTIRSLHDAATPGARAASAKKIKILVYSFIGALVWCVVTKYAPGVIWDWDFGWFLYSWGAKSAITLHNWGWTYEFTPAFHAVGLLSGPNASFSWMFGCVLAWGIIGPSLVATGEAMSGKTGPFGNKSNMSMSSINLPDGTTDPSLGSARYFLLWPGVFVMIVASFTDLACQSPMIYRSFKQLFNGVRRSIGERRGKDMSHIGDVVPDGDPDPAPAGEQVKSITWVVGLAGSAALTMILAKTEFGLNPGVTLLSLILGFLFAFVGVNASGTTDINPVGVIAKAGQLIIGGVTTGQGLEMKPAQMASLVAGSIVGQSASHSVDMVGDLKTGHLIGASPSAQFWAQLGGSTLGFAFAPALFLLFTKAYPCIIDDTIEKCAFAAPATAAWKAVAIAVTAPNLPITRTCGLTAIGLGIVASLCHLARFFLPPKYAIWIPNWSAAGLAFVVPGAYYPLAMTAGAIVAMVWERRSPKSWEMWSFALAAGLISGEGIGGVFNAVLTIAGADGSIYGSGVGCLGGTYCG